MLSLTVKEYAFLLIGEALIRITDCHGTAMRLAIDAPDTLNILRFDEHGELLTRTSRVVKVEVTTAAMLRVHLTCGHTCEVVSTENRSQMECPTCQALARAVRTRILALRRKTNPAYVRR